MGYVIVCPCLQVLDVSTFRGGNCDDNHMLVRVRIKQIVTSNVKKKKSNDNMDRLKEHKTQTDYRNVVSKYITHENYRSLEDK